MGITLAPDAEAIGAASRPAKRLKFNWRITLRLALAILVFGLALLIRLRAADYLTTDYDEDDYLRAGQLYAQHIAAGDISAIANERENYEHPPMMKLAYGVVLFFQGEQSYANPVKAFTGSTNGPASIADKAKPLRDFSAVVGALTAGVVALVNPLAGLLVAINSWHIKYTSQAYLEALPCFFAALTLLLLRRSKRNGDGWFWVAAITLGLAGAGKYLYGIAGFGALIWFVWRERSSKFKVQGSKFNAFTEKTSQSLVAKGFSKVRDITLNFELVTLNLVLWCAVVLVTFFIADPALWPDPVGRLIQSFSFNTSYATGTQVQTSDFGWAQPITWLLTAVPWITAKHPEVFPVMMDGLFSIFGLLAMKRLWRSDRLIVFWFGVTMLFLFFWPTKWPQYILTVTVPISLAAAIWLQAQGQALREGWRNWRTRDRLKPDTRKELALWLLPTGLLFVLIVILPILLQIALATTNFGFANIRNGTWGLLDSFGRGLLGQPPDFTTKTTLLYTGTGSIFNLLMWPGFLPTLRFNLLWVVVTMAFATVLGLWLATLLQRPGVKGRLFWRTLFILPWAVPEFVGALIWSTIFDDVTGGVNNFARVLTEANQYDLRWLTSPKPVIPVNEWVKPVVEQLQNWHLDPFGGILDFVAGGLSFTPAFAVVVLVGVWVSFPFMMMVSTVALGSIPGEVYDAARVDGGKGWTLWRYITWPLIQPSIWSGVMLRGILLFNAFQIPLMLVSDNDRTGTATLSLAAYGAIRYNNGYSIAALINTVVLALAIGLVWFFNQRTRVVEGVEYV